MRTRIIIEFLEDIGIDEADAEQFNEEGQFLSHGRRDSGVFDLKGLRIGGNSSAAPNSMFVRTMKTAAEAKPTISATHGTTGETTLHHDMKSARAAVGNVKGSYATHLPSGKIIDRVK